MYHNQPNMYNPYPPYNPYYYPYNNPMNNPMAYPNMPMDAEAYMKDLLMRLKSCEVDILVDGREGIFKDLIILNVEDGVVITQAPAEVCVIPIKDITTIFMSKELANRIYQYY
ncbi:hypothetical protein [Alkaliphilus serpentinus]|uniref:Uncharacterized protein n=1 Tax=Alkaliphilus serpentinus TaxID=1482731 RepID=A0A833HL52_9FIRM|nr:hypothetical protein [Alkaliphilus serpentinus]KAB3524856.1 hypothetical protein F8153_15660 [Alkaliphilus serpentinus]